MATAAPKVNLIPWDHTSEAHVERLIAQRKACGWGADEVVSSWVPRAEKGLKTMFWVVLTDSLPDREQLHQAHKEKYPNETTPLHDTARSLNLTPREPSGVAFVPIGHVAMNNDPTPDLAEHASRLLPETGVYWISSLYISPTMQARGLGRAVMSHLESLVAQGSPHTTASGPPPPTEGLPPAALAGTTIALDTPPKEWHTGTWALDNFWDPLGLPRPKISNQEWYQQQGYAVFAELPAHRPTEMPSGVVTDVPLLLLKKVLR
ncbi:hypothetical protein GGS24DRAFT_386104 [Hypoxylon argillaceum]|nr:hypothetical protein GGS24DRAFT_386104 [Hypoxylon argillaceum]KAI1153900.1 hypothetical protein F4825DRAFT_227134 [Nemania diffusa]